MAEASDKPAPRGERLAKVIARAGLCSRRDAEKWIEDGRVAVDGSVVRSPAVNVGEDQAVAIDGKPLAARHGTRLWLYHKPVGLVVTEKDPEGRETIFQRLEAEGLPRVLTVGRLDINTEGLLLLTNDGGLKRVLELPATGWLRKYRVRAFGSIDQGRLDILKKGMTVDGVVYGPIEAILERVQGGNVWLLVSLREGKNREVKNVLGALGLEVNRLIRVSYGPFQLGDLPIGAVSVVKAKVLRDQLGDRLAKEAGVDFDSAFPDDPPAEPPKAPSKNPRDPNARLRQRTERPGKPVARPKPRTGEPHFAKQRAAGKFPDRHEEVPTIKRRILFDDGSKLVEDTGRPRAERGKDDTRRGPPRDGGRPGARSDRPDRPRGERGAEEARRGPSRSAGRPSTRPDVPRGERGDRDTRRGPPRDGDKSGARSDRPRPGANDGPRSDAPRKAWKSGPRTGDGPRSSAGPRNSSGPRSGGASGPRDRASPARPRGGPGGGRPGADRPAGGKTGGRPAGSRPAGDRPGGRPAGGRPGGKPAGGRPGGKPAGGRPGGKPTGGRPGGKPAGGRPGGKPGGTRPKS
ncbi:MAG: pseudouridine synthase [Alphaproteobacteria bacterium]|nr:pseudouridine synthase [Alphaproteobacteria bacterium]